MIKTKDAVLAYLKKCGNYVSGETLGETLGISRMAINSAVNTLRRDGYEISSVTNKGYCVTASPDVINDGELLARLPAERLQKVLLLDSVDSTNNRLHEMAVAGAPDGQVIIAESQQAGRGRYGRTFVSPRGKGIYLSVLFRPIALQPVLASTLAAWVAVAMGNAVYKVCGVRPDIKWVNDLVLGKRKICGILTETTVESETGHIRHVIVGAGLYVNERPEAFPHELQNTATSLFAETGIRYNRAQIAAQMITELDTLGAAWPQEKEHYLKAYRQNCITVGNTVRLSGKEERIGYAQDIDDNFGLIVRFDDGTQTTVISGEASVRGLYGYV